MTKKDYELIAGILANSGDVAIMDAYKQEQVEHSPNVCLVDNAMNLWQTTCEEFADKLAKDNARFDAVIFLEACGFDGILGDKWRAKYTK